MPRLPQIDLLSFWLGFLVATFFWFLLGRMRPLLPAIRERFRLLIRTIRERNLQGANDYLRQETVRRAQRWHQAASLFALDDILLPPLLIAPPASFEPEAAPEPESAASRVIPYMPEWPEFLSGYGYPRLTLAEALSSGNPIAVTGRPGSGKTVTLAHLACQVARKETAAGVLMDYAPLLMHVLDIDLTLEEKKDPLETLFNFLTSKAPVLLQSQLRRLILERFKEGRALILLDGVDELPPEQHGQVTAYIKAILTEYPDTRLAITTTPDWIDGLADIGIAPLALSAWSQPERDIFLKRWNSAWNEYIVPNLSRHDLIHLVSPDLLTGWLATERGFVTPLEWTLKVWEVYAGDIKGPTNLGAIETFLARFCKGLITRPILEKIARQFLVRAQAGLRYGELDRVITEQTGPRLPTVMATPPEEETQTLKKKKKGRRDLILSTGEQIIEELVNSGLLAEHSNELIRITSPVFAGVLAAFQVSTDDLVKAVAEPHWPLYNQSIHYLAARSNEADWIDEFLYVESSILARNLQITSRWLLDAPPSASWRPHLFRALASLIQDESLPLGLRARAVAGFVVSNDPSLPRLFRQLFASQSEAVRQVSALGAGAWGEPTLIPDIGALMSDPSEPVRISACLALTAIHTDNAINMAAEVMMNGDEGLRQAAAEAIALLPNIGPDIMKEASGMDDILTRRAAVFGLAQLHDPWAKQLLEKITIEDSQWVVRNVAAQALDDLEKPDHHIPRPMPKPWDCGWLIAFASKRGIGVGPNQPANDLLHMALTTGTLDEQLGALEFARFIHDEKILVDVYGLFYSGEREIGEAALITISYWSMSGVKLPAPQQIELSH